MIPTLAVVGTPGPRWLPPVPIPLFPLWPLIPLCLGIARLLEGERPVDAAKLRTAIQVFRDLRGLVINVNASGHRQVRVRFP